jgi:hypothetical protein
MTLSNHLYLHTPKALQGSLQFVAETYYQDRINPS